MLGLTVYDWATLLIYLVGITALGLWMARVVHNTSDFFMGGRRFGKLMMMMHSFGTGTHSDQAISVASKTHDVGMSGIWYQWLWLFCTPFYWLIAPVFRRMRAITTGDYFQARYDRGVAGLYAVVGTLQLMVNIGLMLKASGVLVRAVTGGQVSEAAAMWAMTALFVAYGVAGGLAAAIVTDFVQGLFTIVLSFLVLPFAMQAVGGFAGLHEKITDASKFALVVQGDITVFYISVIALNALIGIVTQPHTMAVCAAGRTELEGRVGFCWGTFIKRFCTVAWTLTGLCAIVLYPDLKEHDHAFGAVARDVLGKAMPGLIGIFIASTFASVMSSCDSFMLACSGLVTENIYRPVMTALGRDRTERHYVTVGRCVSIAVVAGGIGFAYSLKSVVEALEIFWKLAPMMGIAFWVGLFWRRATSAAAWASTLVGFGVYYATTRPEVIEWLGSASPGLVKEGKVWLPWQMVLYLSAAFVTMIVVSLFTRRVPAEQLDRFYGLVRTPVQLGEVVPAPCTLPDGVEPPPVRKLINHPDLEFYVPTWLSVIGFAAAWVAVGAIIAGVFWLVGIGA